MKIKSETRMDSEEVIGPRNLETACYILSLLALTKIVLRLFEIQVWDYIKAKSILSVLN